MNNPHQEFPPEFDIDDDISDEDYGFILDRDGNLKSVFLPDDVTEVPEKVQEILELFEISSIDSLKDPAVTVH